MTFFCARRLPACRALLGFGALRDFARFAVMFYSAPHVPTGYGAVGTPAFAESRQLARLGDFFFAVGEGETFLHAVIVDGQHVGSAQAEDQKHFNGPRTDAAHGDEALD